MTVIGAHNLAAFRNTAPSEQGDKSGKCAKRIVLVIGGLGGGGAERVLVDFANYLISVGRDVALLTIMSGGEEVYELDGRVTRLRVDIRRDSKNLAEAAIREVRGLRQVRSIILRFRPDVVVSFIDLVNVRSVAALMLSSVPVVVSERTHPGHANLGRLWSFLRRLSYLKAAAVVVQTRDGADWIRTNIGGKRLHVIPNAVRLTAFDPVKFDMTQPKSIVGLGRLSREKGFDMLIRAFALSGVAAMGWRLVIAGDGPARAELEALAEDMGLASQISLPGYVKDAAALLRGAEIFALSSRFEGFPNALIEAMQLGRPVVSFDCPSGPRDLVVDGDNGILLPPQDVGALAEAIRSLAADPATRARLGAAAMAVNERFSPQRVYGMWLDLIDSLSLRQCAND